MTRKANQKNPHTYRRIKNGFISVIRIEKYGFPQTTDFSLFYTINATLLK